MRDDYVSASELARLGYCERQVAFDAACGEVTSTAQRVARERGTAAHEAFYEEGKRIAERSARRGYCFVATMALGECAETNALRAWRDLYLRRSVCGRRLIRLYYRASPGLCRWLETRPVALAACRKVVGVCAWVAGLAVKSRLGKRDVS